MHHHSIRTVHTNGFSASYSTHGEDQPLLGSLETLHHNLLASDTNLALTHRRRDGEGEREWGGGRGCIVAGSGNVYLDVDRAREWREPELWHH